MAGVLAWVAGLFGEDDRRQKNPHTMSLEELRRSSLLAGVDVVLFFAASVLATLYWLETRSRVRELQHMRVDADTLVLRVVFLQLLSISNSLRALGIVVDSQLRVLFAETHKLAWRRWLDYLISSLPTLIWCSMLSVLLLYIIEIYDKTQLRRATLLRPTFLFLNAVAYLLYGTFGILTLHLAGPTYQDFRRFAYFELGCLHVVLSAGLLRYGLGLRWQLRQRTKAPLPMGATVAPTQRVTLLAVLLPVTELARTYNDCEYSLGGLPFNLHSGISSILFLAAAKLMLEWMPSAAILWAFRPTQTGRPKAKETTCCVDPLLPPGSRPEFPSFVLG